MFRKLFLSVPQKKNLTYYSVLFELFDLQCSARGFSMPEVFRVNFWGQKCSAIGKRLGTTDLEVNLTCLAKILCSNHETG